MNNEPKLRRANLRTYASIVVFFAFMAGTGLASSTDSELAASLKEGKAAPQSMSVLTFAPDGTLFVGDSRGGAVFAIATPSPETAAQPQAVRMTDVEGKIGARLGIERDDVLVHDLAVHPKSHDVYVTVSPGRSKWDSRWKLPNHVADASILLRIDREGTIDEVSLEKVRFARVALPNPVAADKQHSFMPDLSLRTDTITDMALWDDTLFVAGLSNEEFASALWQVPVPFADGTSATTVEIFHGAHGAWETHAPIRTFVPYRLNGEDYIFAAYLCTPLSLFKVEDLKDETHIRGRTIAEFGSGNYPLDMIVVPRLEGGESLFMANSNLPLIVLDTEDIAAFEGEIIERPEQYSAGVEHLKRSGSGIQQLDILGDAFLVTLQRMPNGSLDLGSIQLRR